MLSFLGGSDLELVVDDHRFLVQHGNVIMLLYVQRGFASKPCIPVLRGPSGRNVLEDSPGDHVHHHGIWWAHGDVNGVDFYLEVPARGRRLGRIVHTAFTTIVDERPRFGFTETLEWVDDADQTLIRERRRLLAHFVDETHYTVDVASTYTAQRDLTFGDTKESVLPGLRVAEALTPVCGGTLTSSEGGTGEKEVMGRPAAWIDYSAPRTAIYGLGTTVDGIATLSHPSNPQHPPVVFARDYGPSSPFQGHLFTGPTDMEAGGTLETRHRFVVHHGDAAEADVAGKYETWIEEGP